MVVRRLCGDPRSALDGVDAALWYLPKRVDAVCDIRGVNDERCVYAIAS